MAMMKLHRYGPIALLGSAILVAVAAQPPARAQDTAPVRGALTHLNVPAANLVNLRAIQSTSPYGGNLREMRADGTLGAEPYTVPAGHSLVVTDWTDQRRLVAGSQRTIHWLYKWLPSQPQGLYLIYEAPGEYTHRFGDSTLRVHFTAGLVVPAGGQLSNSPHPDSTLPGMTRIQGYLVSDTLVETGAQ